MSKEFQEAVCFGETIDENMQKCNPSPKMDRKTAEKFRRTQMRELYSKLNSLTSRNHSKEVPMLSEQIDKAINHIVNLQEKLEKMNERKKILMENKETKEIMDNEKMMDLPLPFIEVQDLGPALVVLFICGFDNQLVFYKSIRILEEEGAEVVNAGFFVMGEKVFHTIHAKVSDPKDDFAPERVSGRLYKLVHEKEL